ncbi:MAG TPA: AAA family ATPase [Gemmataceae bacterium]|nr:AAA family ATPase [Gemmataceae bacterium]
MRTPTHTHNPSSNPPPSIRPYGTVWLNELAAAPVLDTAWLWRGYLARGNVTLLTSQWKMGKTTLLTVLLQRLGRGGLLAGLPVTPGKAVVVSEESHALWAARSRHLELGDHVALIARPFLGKPEEAQWLELLEHVAEMHRQHGVDLVVIDPLAAFLPGHSENTAAELLAAVLPLQRLTQLGLAVLLLHHPRKHASDDGQAARGSGALTGFADILVEMHWFAHAAEADRRRVLRAWSRLDETPRQLVIELNADGTDYRVVADRPQQEFAESWRVLEGVLLDATHKLTRQEILDGWPADHERPQAKTLWRWLEQALTRALVLREGTGRRNDAFRYWLPGQEERWQNDPLAALEQSGLEALRLLQEQPAGAFEPPHRRRRK